MCLKNKGEIKTFPENELSEFIVSKIALKGILKEAL